MNSEQVLELTRMVDAILGRIAGQTIVSSSEMTDSLLDIRLFLMSSSDLDKVS